MIGTSKRAVRQKSYRLPIDSCEELRQSADYYNLDETAMLKVAIHNLHRDAIAECRATYGIKYWLRKIARNFHEDELDLESSCMANG